MQNIDIVKCLTCVFLGTFVIGNLSNFIKEKYKLQSSYARKINHFGISLVSIIVFMYIPIEHTFANAVFTSIVVIFVYTLSCYSKNKYIKSIIESNVRERDEPNGKFFVFLHLITGQLALYTSLFFFNPVFAKIAFCSMGFGDGLAEPIGVRFGKHKYVVNDRIWGVKNTKSIEGSFAVFFVSFISCCSMLALYTDLKYLYLLLISLPYAAFIALVEAISPRGLDNFLIILCGVLSLYAIDWMFPFV